MADSQSIEYVKNSLAQGKTTEDIYKDLLGQGWTVALIQEAFNAVPNEKEKEDTSKRTIHIIVTIGAILVGAGIFSFIAANWEEMARSAKLAVIMISMIVSYASGWYMKEKSQLLKTGEALILLGSIIYGAGIFLVAQMYNIRANWPDGFILWMIGTIAMAYAMEAYSLYYLGILLGIVALVGHPFGIFTDVGYNSFILTSSFLLLAATVITFITGWFLRKKIAADIKEFY